MVRHTRVSVTFITVFCCRINSCIVNKVHVSRQTHYHPKCTAVFFDVGKWSGLIWKTLFGRNWCLAKLKLRYQYTFTFNWKLPRYPTNTVNKQILPTYPTIINTTGHTTTWGLIGACILLYPLEMKLLRIEHIGCSYWLAEAVRGQLWHLKRNLSGQPRAVNLLHTYIL